ncbi:MAG: excinuclease ABC subunit A [Pseudooceanicola sp.]
MRHLMIIAALALTGAPAMADPGGNKHARDYAQAGCPPGLAKKNNGCRPPGLAKKQRRSDGYHDRDGYYDRDRYYDRTRYRVGQEIIDFDDLVLIRDPGRYGLDPYGTYYRDREHVIRVDRETQEVLALVGLVSAILGN